jgi:Glyoxalase/Bleomycin resistance protein/Dioxygenase superfamily
MTGDAPRRASGLFDDPRPIRELGDLFANLWQVCYVTPDLERGVEELRDLLGVMNSIDVPMDGAMFMKRGEQVEWETRVAMGARGGLIIELIEPVSGEVEVYRRALPKDGGALALHHLSMLVPLGSEPWHDVEVLIEERGLSIEYTIVVPDRARLAYVDTTAQLGHWIEVCQLQKADTDFFSGLIADST